MLVTAEGPNHSLKFYWALIGKSLWTSETVAGDSTTYSAPSITVNKYSNGDPSHAGRTSCLAHAAMVFAGDPGLFAHSYG